MSKIQQMIGIFIVLVVILSMAQMFPMFPMFPKDTFIDGTGLGFIGHKLNYNTLATPLSQTNGNLGYPGKAYLGLAFPPPNYRVNANNDQGLSYGFPMAY